MPLESSSHVPPADDQQSVAVTLRALLMPPDGVLIERGGAHGSAASRVLRGRAAKPPGEERGRRSSRQHLYLIRMEISYIFHRRLAAAFANSANLVAVVPAIHRWKNVLLKA